MAYTGRSSSNSVVDAWVNLEGLVGCRAACGNRERVPLLDGQRSGEKLNILSSIFVRKCSPKVAHGSDLLDFEDVHCTVLFGSTVHLLPSHLHYAVHFYARQHICYSAYMLWQFRLSVRLSVGSRAALSF